MDKVKKYIVENNLLQKGDKVLVALSGGPDSVCLLYILKELKEEFDIKLGAIHINHMLRSEESYKDEEYTKYLCKELNVEYYVKRVDINQISNSKNISLELAGREERYKAFEEVKKGYNYTKVAVAHNANDQAETILMRIMRGTGLEGLTGIKVKREDGVIRPILCLSREEIEIYCEINKLNPRIDQSNYEKIYNRNKVRLDIIPYMKENFNEDIVETLNRMTLILQKDNEYLEKEAKKSFLEKCEIQNSKIKIPKEIFKDEYDAIITRIIKEAFKLVSKSHQNFETKHIYDVIELAKKETGKRIHLTNNVIVENLYGDILFKKREMIKEKVLYEDENVEIMVKELPSEMNFKNYTIKMEVISEKNNIDFSNNDLIKFFNYDNIKERILIRTKKDGDKMVPIGMNGTKKLKDIFINLKVPRDERDNIPIVCFDDKISWIVGHKVSQQYKITKDTKKILKIAFERKE